MSGKYKLTYFNIKGRAELARLIFAQAKVSYEDVRITGEQWGQLKPNTPAGQIPILEHNGETIAQSMAIARYLAKEFNLAGKNNWEQAKADMIGETVQDLFNAAAGVKFESNETVKAAKEEKFKNDTLPNFFKTTEKVLKANGGKHFVGSDVTYADLAVFNALDVLEGFGVAWKPLSPTLVKFCEEVAALPEIKKWIAARPT